MTTLYINREALEKEGYFSNLPAIVEHQGGLCGCESDEDFFTCELCRREVPFCYGASDQFDDLCDACAVRQQAGFEYLTSI